MFLCVPTSHSSAVAHVAVPQICPSTNVSAWKLDFERIIAPSMEFGRANLITPTGTHGTLQNRKTVETRSNYAIFFNITLQFKGSSHYGDKIACVQEATL
jgi:hypothetical protein